ncbi:MAG: hypothetical protein C5B43_00565 [Verrucomicrobia bacterium]|nr:MAG: hypothetical protein C5B43_00565 [Verrucomicrobiota bacterium]
MKLFSVKEISNANSYYLKEFIENSGTFQARVKKVNPISHEDIIKIRREIQCQTDFINKASVDELVESAHVKFSKKYILVPEHPYKREFLLKYLLNLQILADEEEDMKLVFRALDSVDRKFFLHGKETIHYYEQLLKFKDLPENIRTMILKRLFNAYERAFDKKDLSYVPDKKRAIECCEELLKTLESTSELYPRVLNFLTSLYYEEKMIDKVIECLGKHRYTETSIYFQSFMDLAEKCEKERNYEGAALCYEYVVKQTALPYETRLSILKKHLPCVYEKLQNIKGVLSCFESIVSLPKTDVNEKVDALFKLAELDTDPDNQIGYHERVLALPEVSIRSQLNTLSRLSYVYLQQGNIMEQINCQLRRLALFIGSELDNKEEMEATVLDELIALYYKTENTAKVIECYENISKLQNIHSAGRFKALRGLCTLYKKANDKTFLIETLTRLAQLYLADKESKDASKLAIDCYKEILEIPGQTETQKIEAFTQLTSLQQSVDDIQNEVQYITQLLENEDLVQFPLFQHCLLIRLANIYKDRFISKKEIEFYNLILELPNLSVEFQRQSLKRLIEIDGSNTRKQIELYEQLLEISKWPEYQDQYDILIGLARLYSATNNTELEINSYERILKLPSIQTNTKIETLFSLALLYKKIGKTSLAMECYKTIFEMPNAAGEKIVESVKNWLELSSSISDGTVETDLSGIFAAFHSCSRLNANLFTCLNANTNKSLFVCYTLILNNFPKLKLDFLNKLAKLFLHLDYSDCNREISLSSAIQCYERILTIEDLSIDDQIKTLKRLASCHSKKEDTKKAIEYLNRLLSYKKLSPYDQYASYTFLGNSYYRLKKINKAIHCYEFILTNLNLLLHAEYEALTSLAAIYRNSRRSPLAITCYERIVSSSHTDETEKIAALKTMAALCNSIDNVDKEIWCYETLISNEITSEDEKKEWLENIIYIYKQINNIDTTIEGFERILKLPNLTTDIKLDLLVRLSLHYTKTKNKVKKIECYQHIIKLPDIDLFIRINSYKMLSSIYIENKDIPKAIECQESILKLDGLENKARIKSLKVLDRLCHQINNSEKTLDVLFQLAKLYLSSNDSQNEVFILKRILENPNLSPDNFQDTLLRLGSLYLQLNKELKAIDIIERFLKISQLSPIETIGLMEDLAELYHKIENLSKAVEYYERIIAMVEEIQLDQDTLKSYNIKPIKILEYLANYYSENNDTIKGIQYSELILKLTSINDEEHLTYLIKLESLYGKIDYKQQILYNELILKCPNLSFVIKCVTLKNLIELYLKDGDFNKARDYHHEVLKLGRKEFLDTLLIFLNHPKFGLSENVKMLLFAGSPYNIQKILDLLASYYWLWSDVIGKPKKLTDDQWLTLLGKTNIPSELECIALQPCITVSGLNKDYFLNDPTMALWNILTQRPGDIDNSDWDVVKVMLVEINSAICGESDNQEYYLLKFLNQCMASRDAMTPLGKQFIRKRIASVVDYLVDLRQSSAEDNLNTRIFKDALSIMKVGGMGCPDRATTFIVYLEGYIKLMKNPEYLANIMVQLFKFEAISSVLVLEVDGDIIEENGKIIEPKEKENIEAYLFYILALNKILNLGLPENGTMLYPDIAKVVPLEDTIEPLSKFFTQSQLIEFTIKHTLFKERFENEKGSALHKKREEFSLAFDDLSDFKVNTPPYNEQKSKVDQLEQSLKIKEKLFYSHKAKELFEKAGFLGDKVHL